MTANHPSHSTVLFCATLRERPAGSHPPGASALMRAFDILMPVCDLMAVGYLITQIKPPVTNDRHI
ncbi:hypothetical protein [Fulvimarina sp. MAC8]|uniref:hypothetical protein n=1 Tax=Fulvimarina sp. MAC8 TaxID=3162874 RepID=UPI0032F09ADD